MDWYITPLEYEIAKSNGISGDTLEHRVRYHCWDKQKAITEPLRTVGHLKKWFELAKENGIKEVTFKNRIYKLKWDYLKAATYKKDARKVYPSWVYDKLKENNIKYNTFLKRIENNWDIERACSERTWTDEESTRKGRSVQRINNTGPFKSTNDFWKLEKSKSAYFKLNK